MKIQLMDKSLYKSTIGLEIITRWIEGNNGDGDGVDAAVVINATNK
jgi:hypothetical protein